MTPFLAEFLGTALLILLGNGVVGNVVLTGTKGNGSGWIVITWGWGGLVEFYRSPARLAWTPTGLNVPDYALLAQLWWTRIGQAVTGRASPEAALDDLAQAQDDTLQRLARADPDLRCAPRLAPAEDASVWLARPGAPKPPLENEKPPGRTIDYQVLIASWTP